ncbi:MAG: hypothetical protein F2681_09815 [Actinobacteria bacterium]|uniref:Unannotated protein n=1 Tax=freshwater metagenome TaxID=449393 RepID=A0A6J7BPF3_9ZZZZ|nr:hypothetical protein [Actinomycetota bacterium]MSW76837.1 hypothetical protein [Actinomycetota bacterium]MSX53903.1 hypothetical protein [Actinomycetota bacterium]MSX92281.1 hypothetical protein [Actinomycetota bacterium]MSZ83427.1 hypothetical protein [Actinomycetota bacterium]
MGIYAASVPRSLRRSHSFLTRHATWLGPALIVFAGALTACGAQTANNGGAASNGGGSSYSSPGEEVYVLSCARCHGADRTGDYESPGLDATRIASLGDQPLQFTIAYGKGKMPGFGGLTTQQVTDLIAYLKGY